MEKVSIDDYKHAATPYQRVSERVQHWNRSVPDTGYIRLGTTIHYGIKLRNPKKLCKSHCSSLNDSMSMTNCNVIKCCESGITPALSTTEKSVTSSYAPMVQSSNNTYDDINITRGSYGSNGSNKTITPIRRCFCCIGSVDNLILPWNKTNSISSPSQQSSPSRAPRLPSPVSSIDIAVKNRRLTTSLTSLSSTTTLSFTASSYTTTTTKSFSSLHSSSGCFYPVSTLSSWSSQPPNTTPRVSTTSGISKTSSGSVHHCSTKVTKATATKTTVLKENYDLSPSLICCYSTDFNNSNIYYSSSSSSYTNKNIRSNNITPAPIGQQIQKKNIKNQNLHHPIRVITHQHLADLSTFNNCDVIKRTKKKQKFNLIRKVKLVEEDSVCNKRPSSSSNSIAALPKKCNRQQLTIIQQQPTKNNDSSSNKIECSKNNEKHCLFEKLTHNLVDEEIPDSDTQNLLTYKNNKNYSIRYIDDSNNITVLTATVTTSTTTTTTTTTNTTTVTTATTNTIVPIAGKCTKDTSDIDNAIIKDIICDYGNKKENNYANYHHMHFMLNNENDKEYNNKLKFSKNYEYSKNKHILIDIFPTTAASYSVRNDLVENSNHHLVEQEYRKLNTEHQHTTNYTSEKKLALDEDEYISEYKSIPVIQYRDTLTKTTTTITHSTINSNKYPHKNNNIIERSSSLNAINCNFINNTQVEIPTEPILNSATCSISSVILQQLSTSNPKNSTLTIPPTSTTTTTTLRNCNCFKRVQQWHQHQAYDHLSLECNINMEKRKNTLDRLQVLRFGKRSTSNPDDKKSAIEKNDGGDSSKRSSERLREITELFIGSRQLGVIGTQSPQQQLIPPPIPPPRKPRHSNSLEKSLNDTCVMDVLLDDVDQITKKPKTSLIKSLRPNHSISNFTYTVSDDVAGTFPISSSVTSSVTDTHSSSKVPEQNLNNDNLDRLPPLAQKEDDLFITTSNDKMLPLSTTTSPTSITTCTLPVISPIISILNRPSESRNIIGSYTRRSIPFRSASFSQIDYTSGKYIRNSLGAIKSNLNQPCSTSSTINTTNTTKGQQPLLMENTNLTLPRTKANSRSSSPITNNICLHSFTSEEHVNDLVISNCESISILNADNESGEFYKHNMNDTNISKNMSENIKHCSTDNANDCNQHLHTFINVPTNAITIETESGSNASSLPLLSDELNVNSIHLTSAIENDNNELLGGKEKLKEISGADDIPKLINDETKLYVQKASVMVLESISDEELPLITQVSDKLPATTGSPLKSVDEYLQTATTCLIPVPVDECTAEWGSTNTSEQWLNALEIDSSKIIEELNNGTSIEFHPNHQSFETSRSDDKNRNGNINNDIIIMKYDRKNEKEATNKTLIGSNNSNINVDLIEYIPKISVVPGSGSSSSGSSSDTSNGDKGNTNCSSYTEDSRNADQRNRNVNIIRDSQANTNLNVKYNNEHVEVRKRHENQTSKCRIPQQTKNDGNAIISIGSSNNKSVNLSNSCDERRRIDKSKRRKGIYIQWPTIDKHKNVDEVQWESVHEDVMEPFCRSPKHTTNNIPEDLLLTLDCENISSPLLQTSSENSALTKSDFVTPNLIDPDRHDENPPLDNLYISYKSPSIDECQTPNSEVLFSPSTPNSEYNQPIWPRIPSRRPSLTYQSSDEKDDFQLSNTPKIPSDNLPTHKLLYLRSDSMSDNDSDRSLPPPTPTKPKQRLSSTPFSTRSLTGTTLQQSPNNSSATSVTSRDVCSQSPAPLCEYDLKRYSKRPLRGPYGQMLEAEMKKPAKLNYDGILEEFNRTECSNSLELCNRDKQKDSSLHSLADDSLLQQSHHQHTPYNTQASSKSIRVRKNNAHLPVPCHIRASSTPIQNTCRDSNNYSNIDNCNALQSQNEFKFKHKRSPTIIDDIVTTATNTKKYSFDSNEFNNNNNNNNRSPKQVISAEVINDNKLSTTNKNDTTSHRNSVKLIKQNLDGMHLQTNWTPTSTESNFILSTPQVFDTVAGNSNIKATPELLAALLKGSSEKIVAEQHSLNKSNFFTLPMNVLKFVDTRTHVVIELFNTEKSYVESLETVVSKYLNPLKSPENAGIVDAQTVDKIFFMVPDILSVHARFLQELRRRLDAWEPQQKVGDAFVEVFSIRSVLETYTSFVNNWNKAKNAIRSTSSSRPAFARFLHTMEREHKGKLSLDNLLIKPVQKFPNYELIFSRLIKNTDNDHPDQQPLQDAIKLVHEILLHLNCIEKEAFENGQREATLRELEGIIEGINDLVTNQRIFILFDLVSMPTGQAGRKERGLFLFSDILVVTSIKRRSGTIRKPNTTTCLGSVALTLDTNKYKFLMKISLEDLEIIKAKDENIRKMMKDIENLNEDGIKLQQIVDIVSSLKCPHQLVEDNIRDLQRDNQKQLSDRQSNDSQLCLMDLTINTSNGGQNMTVVFSKSDKRTHFEHVFTEVKKKLGVSLERHPVPEFLSSIPIRKTRAGLQFTCAAPTLGNQKDVWVCNSDGYVGQVCVLSLSPEPTVTSCNGVCNARILSVASVPATGIESSPNSSRCASIYIENPSIQKASDRTDNKSSEMKSSVSYAADHIQIDSNSSSSSDDSETENILVRSVSPASMEQYHQQQQQQSPLHQHHESNSDDSGDNQQSTMWLGTEDGCVHVYNCTDNIRIKKNKIKIQHISAVYSILYLDNRVFVSLANGDLFVYLRDQNGWNTTIPLNITIGSVSSPITKLVNVHGKLWCAIQGIIKILNTSTLQVEHNIQIASDCKSITNMVVCTNYVWISVQNSPLIKCYHSFNHSLVFEVNLAPSVNKMLSNCDDIIRQHKAACLRVTSLLACKDLIWAGTSAGVILTISVMQSTRGSIESPNVTGIPHGHTGHVRFLTCVENERNSGNCSSADRDSTNLGIVNVSQKNTTNSTNWNSLYSSSTLNTLETTNILIISGGDGYEDFRNSGTTPISEVAGREDSTNHLLLWQG